MTELLKVDLMPFDAYFDDDDDFNIGEWDQITDESGGDAYASSRSAFCSKHRNNARRCKCSLASQKIETECSLQHYKWYMKQCACVETYKKSCDRDDRF